MRKKSGIPLNFARALLLCLLFPVSIFAQEAALTGAAQAAQAPDEAQKSQARPAVMLQAEPQDTALPTESIEQKFERKVTLDLRDMDIIDVFKFLSLKGEFNIVVSKGVIGRVTLVLKRVKIADALDIISLANGLGYKIVSDIVYIMPEAEYFQTYGKYFRDKTRVKIFYLKYVRPSYAMEALKNVKSEIGKLVVDEDTGSVVMIDTEENIKEMEKVLEKIDHRLQTKVFSLNSAKAETVKEKLRERLDVKAVGSIQADERSNKVIITALPERFSEIEPLIEALDQRHKEVLIKVKILKIILNPKFDFGIDWEKAFSNSRYSTLRSLDFRGAFPIASSISTSGSLGTVGKMAIGNVSADQFSIEIKALKQVSDTKVLANPQILVVNNEEAKIHIGDKLAYVTTTTTGTGADQTTNEEIHFIDTGILLNVKPVISEDGFISMTIKPEISSQSGTLTTPKGATVPLINTTLIESKVMVKDGVTIVIGGLHKDEGSKSHKGLPGLSEVPFIGGVFRNVSDQITKTEIVIFLTPTIIDGSGNFDGAYQPELSPMKEY